MDLNDLYRKNWNCEFGCKHTRKIIITSAVPRCAQPLAPFDCGCIAIKKILVLPRGYREFINYPGSFFFVKALITPPLPSCLPNRVCFHPKMVCFSFFSFFVSQDLHATSRLVLRHTTVPFHSIQTGVWPVTTCLKFWFRTPPKRRVTGSNPTPARRRIGPLIALFGMSTHQRFRTRAMWCRTSVTFRANRPSLWRVTFELNEMGQYMCV